MGPPHFFLNRARLG